MSRHPSTRQAASARKPMPISGESSIAPVEQLPANRCDRKQINRPRPPNAPQHIPIGIGALNLPSIRQEQPEIRQHLRFRQRQPFADPAALQRCDLKAAFGERSAPEWHPAPAKSARVVVQNPALRHAADRFVSVVHSRHQFPINYRPCRSRLPMVPPSRPRCRITASNVCQSSSRRCRTTQTKLRRRPSRQPHSL